MERRADILLYTNPPFYTDVCMSGSYYSVPANQRGLVGSAANNVALAKRRTYNGRFSAVPLNLLVFPAAERLMAR